MRRTWVLVAAVLAFAAGCAQIPKAQLAGYTGAFAHVQDASEQVLLDFDAAMKESNALIAKRKPAASAAPLTAFPLTWAEISAATQARAIDDIEVRRRAFKVVADFNAVLVQLAEGKSVEEVKAASSGLLASTDKLLVAAKGAGAAIAGLPAITGIVSTLVEAFEKARLREEFVKAVEKGAPVVDRIIDVLAADIAAHYDVRAKLATLQDKRLINELLNARDHIRQIVKAHDVPDKDIVSIEKFANEQLSVARAVLPDLVLKLESGGTNAPDIDSVAKAQLEDEKSAMTRASKAYQSNVAAMKACAEMLGQYEKLLRAAQASLKVLVKSLDQPVDLAASADDLVATVFALRRDIAALREANANR